MGTDKVNIVLIFADDQGYGDLGCFGSKKIKRQTLIKWPEEGRKFTNFMVVSPVCTLPVPHCLTGCYPKRLDYTNMFFFQAQQRFTSGEYTLADHFKSQGYATACYGKWHLGHHPETLPGKTVSIITLGYLFK